MGEMMFPELGNWIQIKDGDPRGMALFKRHYSYHEYKDNRRRRLFVGPGGKMVLITRDCDALFVWRKIIMSDDGQVGVNCAVFRNEGKLLSSELILEAEKLAWLRWPFERLYTYVALEKILSTNPGYCFKIAGWVECGITKINKHVILEKYSR